MRQILSPNRWLLGLSASSSLIYWIRLNVSPPPGNVVFKALSIAPLAVLAYRSLPRTEGRLLSTALFFSLVGDLFLGIDAVNFFVEGLGSFLMAHLFYILLFVRLWFRPNVRISKAHRIRNFLTLSIFFFSVAMTAWLWSDLHSFTAPVLIYVCVITLMAAAAIRAPLSTAWVATGALLFLFSDTLIAVGKFKALVPFGNNLVWLTYYLAQLFITMGFLHEKFDPPKRTPQK